MIVVLIRYDYDEEEISNIQYIHKVASKSKSKNTDYTDVATFNSPLTKTNSPHNQLQ